MKKVIIMLLMAVAVNAMAAEWYDESTGFTWYYTVSGDAATLTGCSPKEGKLPPLPSMLGGKSVKMIGKSAFGGCSGLRGSLIIPDSVIKLEDDAFAGCSGFTGSLIIPNSVTTIGSGAFWRCSGITGSLTIGNSVTTIGLHAFKESTGFTGSLIIPDSVTTIKVAAFQGCSGFMGSLIIGNSVTTIQSAAFSGCRGLTDVFFKGLPPSVFDGLPVSGLSFPEKYAVEWRKVLAHKNIREPKREGVPVAKVVSGKMRESDPTVMDVVYKVTSTKPTVKVRALAFQDGERSFAKVVRPETFVEDENGNPTAGNIGDGVTANEEHTLSWKVSADWNATLAKVKFEVLAVEDEILPLELVTLPKTETQPKMVFSWNYVIPSRAFDALLWLYADKDLGLTLTDGVLKNGTVRLADGASCDKTSYDALVYIYGKMGYELLQGERLDYVRERSRLDLPGISERQYAVKVIEE